MYHIGSVHYFKHQFFAFTKRNTPQQNSSCFQSQSLAEIEKNEEQNTWKTIWDDTQQILDKGSSKTGIKIRRRKGSKLLKCFLERMTNI